MTIAAMTDFFDLLQDKYGSPYFTTAEKERLLIQAEWSIISSYLPQDGGEVNLERNANTWMVLNPLLFSYSHAMSGGNTIVKATVESSITTSLGFATKIIRPAALSWTIGSVTVPVKAVRYNSLAVYLLNVFKTPTTAYPRYHETATNYTVLPNSTSGTVLLYGLRSPRPMSVSGGFTSELSEVYHNEIVARALEYAGVGTRDQMLAELQKVNNV
jgi:hypothetical protein